jgi:hypothetical protein
MARLYADENFPLAVVVELRRLGHDLTTVQETGNAGQSWPDENVLSFATSDRRAVLTYNRRHFIRLHTQQPAHAGIVACTVDADAIGLALRIHDAICQHKDLSGLLLRVNRPSQ